MVFISSPISQNLRIFLLMRKVSLSLTITCNFDIARLYPSVLDRIIIINIRRETCLFCPRSLSEEFVASRNAISRIVIPLLRKNTGNCRGRSQINPENLAKKYHMSGSAKTINKRVMGVDEEQQIVVLSAMAFN